MPNDTNQQTTMKWDSETFLKFKGAYEQHKDKPDSVFWFNGHQFLVAYAGYMIEALQPRYDRIKELEGQIGGAA